MRLPPTSSTSRTDRLLTNPPEGSLFVTDASTPDDLSTFFRDNYPNLTPNDTSAILSLYSPPLPPQPFHNPYFPTTSLAYGEATFTCPSINLLRHIAAFSASTHGNGKIFAYRYNVLDTSNAASGIGVPHVFEAAAVFGPSSLPAGAGVASSYYTYNAPVVPVVMGYWISFVRALDPGVHRAAGAPAWGGWGEGQRLRIETDGSSMEGVGEAEWERCRFWEGLAGRMRQK